MRKIISLFQRNYDGDRLVRDEITPGAEWVVNGEGIATRKLDGTCCLLKDGKLYKRYDAKHGKKPPIEFVPAQDVPDSRTGHWPGWLPVGNGPEDKWHREAFDLDMQDGTYELCGPKINGNPEGYPLHTLVRHGQTLLNLCPRNWQGLQTYFKYIDIEGIVWHHPDGSMVKIKAKDFGIKRTKV